MRGPAQGTPGITLVTCRFRPVRTGYLCRSEDPSPERRHGVLRIDLEVEGCVELGNQGTAEPGSRTDRNYVITLDDITIL